MGRKVIIILSAVLILNGSTEIHQLLKLPFLVQHYFDHRKEDSGLSILAFLKIHYADRDHPNDNDDKDDNELPFKSIGNIFHIDMPLIEKRITFSAYRFNTNPSTYYSDNIPDQRSFPIFHPPRIA